MSFLFRNLSCLGFVNLESELPAAERPRQPRKSQQMSPWKCNRTSPGRGVPTTPRARGNAFPTGLRPHRRRGQHPRCCDRPSAFPLSFRLTAAMDLKSMIHDAKSREMGLYERFQEYDTDGDGSIGQVRRGAPRAMIPDYKHGIEL